MSRKIQEDLIFPGEVFNCLTCDESNVFFVIIKPSGLAVWRGALCPHVNKDDKNRIGKRIKKVEAEHFLTTEKKEAEKELSQVTDNRKESIQQFISDINSALMRIRIH